RRRGATRPEAVRFRPERASAFSRNRCSLSTGTGVRIRRNAHLHQVGAASRSRPDAGDHAAPPPNIVTNERPHAITTERRRSITKQRRRLQQDGMERLVERAGRLVRGRGRRASR
ncbi:MAG: hypothetical protein ACREQ5_33600, partial [Candidatus Dormibacteria bacterium]